MTQTFAGFLKKLAGRKIREAKSVVLYVENRTDNKCLITQRIESAYVNGKIDAEYRDTLIGYLNACHVAFVKSGRLVDERDGRDWQELGNGGRMRKIHKDSERAG
jgi:hypothetical protein